MEKTSESRFLLLLLYILALHAIGILLFTRGFLLTRNELPFYSRCGDFHVPQAPPPLDPGPSDRCRGSDAARESSCHHRSPVPSEAGPEDCWTRPLVKKVVILVLDALRFDFAAPSIVFTDKPKPWMDKLQVLQQLAFKERSHALLFKFIADPPTTSLQRLKGLTTGSLPTFIDVGNSFGASAIVEDNIIHQLASNGKRIIMMGDDTWLQLFPTEFTQMYPFPSFNVKDLDTVDDGVVQHLFPALYEDSWDVVVGHFLGVDHAGHIFGVESPNMVDKLEKYNKVLEDVISVLKNQSFPGGLHEDTLLLVMGDHGQTLNGDHGGGTAEEIETALFAWNTRWSDHPALQICPCNLDLEKVNDPCICDFQQLDFAATLAVMMGVPIPFGSIGHINPQLLSLLGGSWLTRGIQSFEKEEDGWLKLKWMQGYYRLLRLNGWQVNRYFKQYAESVMSGFSKSDLQKLQVLFIQAQSAQPHFSNSLEPGEDLDQSMLTVADAIEKYTKYLEASASLARSKWTQFSDELMGFGLSILCIAVIVQVNAMYKFWVADSKANYEDCDKIFPLQDMVKGSIVFGISFGISAVLLSKIISFLFQASTSFSWNQLLFAILGGAIFGSAKSFIFYTKIIVEENDKKKMAEIQVTLDPRGAVVILLYVMYGCSLLSNSFILKEPQVVTFFLGSSGFHNLRRALQRRSKLTQAMCFLAMNFLMGFFGSTTIFKDVENQMNNAVSSLSTSTAIGQAIIISFTVYLPMLVLGSYTVKKLWSSCFLRSSSSWVVFFGIPLSYISVMLHWLVGDLAKLQLLFISETTKEVARLQIPQLVYYIVALQTLLLVYEIKDREHRNRKVHLEKLLEDAAMLCLAVWGSLILLLLGRQGPLIILVAAIEGWCLMDMQLLCSPVSEVPAANAVNIVADYSAANFQWSLFTVQIFFSTGHRCAFDGLRYAAAFVGFDKFNIYRQGILLAIDTFGASHVLPVAGLVLLVARRRPGRGIFSSDSFYRSQLFQALLTYGLVRMVTAVFTTVCVTIQRRHLMVWGLFAPKFVFEAVGLLVTDSILVLFYALFRPLLK